MAGSIGVELYLAVGKMKLVLPNFNLSTLNQPILPIRHILPTLNQPMFAYSIRTFTKYNSRHTVVRATGTFVIQYKTTYKGNGLQGWFSLTSLTKTCQ